MGNHQGCQERERIEEMDFPPIQGDHGFEIQKTRIPADRSSIGGFPDSAGIRAGRKRGASKVGRVSPSAPPDADTRSDNHKGHLHSKPSTPSADRAERRSLPV